MLIEKMDPKKNRISRKKEVSAKTDVQIKMRRNEMLIIKSEHIGTYTMAKLTEALRGRQQHVRATPTITSNKTHRCLMIVRLFKHTLTNDTHICANTLNRSQTHSPYFACRQPTQHSTVLGCLHQTVH